MQSDKGTELKDLGLEEIENSEQLSVINEQSTIIN